MNGDVFGGGAGSGLDVLQGNPSRVRDLAVGFGSLRTVRAEASAVAPAIEASLQLKDGRIQGTVTNTSERTLLAPALVLGTSATTLPDIGPGQTIPVNFALVANPNNGFPLSERVVGPLSFDSSSLNESQQRRLVRRTVIDQISYDPLSGSQMSLPGDAVTFLAWGNDPVLPARIEGEDIREVANVLYQVPLAFTVTGSTTFRNDLLRTSVVGADANFFSRDPWTIQLGTGSAEMAWRPLPFEGELTPESVAVALTFGGETAMPAGRPEPVKETTRCDPAAPDCVLPQDALPDIEALDVRTGEWVQFAHLTAGRPYELPDAARWTDPASGEVRIRFVNERPDPTYFQFQVVIAGSVQ
jgi:hypothetical protein